MRGAPSVVVIFPGVFAGADGEEPVAALRVGEEAAFAGEIGIERRAALIESVEISAGGVGLPDFDEGVWNWASIFVQDLSANDDAWADGSAAMLLG